MHFSAELEQLNAHCDDPEHREGRSHCKMDRALKASRVRPGQGRPLGLLLRWLATAEPTKGSHEQLKVDLMQIDSHGVRKASRAAFVHSISSMSPRDQQLAQDILAAERAEQAGVDADEEPLNLS